MERPASRNSAGQAIDAAQLLAAIRLMCEQIDAQLSNILDDATREALRAARGNLSGVEARLVSGKASAADLEQISSALQAAQTASSAASLLSTVPGSPQEHLRDARRQAQQTIAELDDDLYKRKIFDGFLKFSSDEDERAYRKREEENRRALAAARAKGTPEGDLEALAIERRQLLDAGAHGADRSEEWLQRMKQSEEVNGNLRTAMRENGNDTKAADAIERESARSFLKAKGLSESEIDQAMQRGHNVAEVIEPYLSKTVAESTIAPSPEKSSDNGKQPSPHLQEVADALRAAGVTPTVSAALEGHGVQIASTTTTTTLQRVLTQRQP